MELSTFTLSCIRCHHPSPELFIFPNETMSPLNTGSYPYSPGPRTHTPTFCLSKVDASGRLMYVRVERCLFFCDRLIFLGAAFLAFVHVVAPVSFPSFLMLNLGPLHVCHLFVESNKNDTKKPLFTKQTHRHRKQTYGYQRGKMQGMDWGFGIGTCTALYVEWMVSGPAVQHREFYSISHEIYVRKESE